MRDDRHRYQEWLRFPRTIDKLTPKALAQALFRLTHYASIRKCNGYRPME
jgi:hypothetical protein